MTRGELITELAATLGHRHEARFIVDEVGGAGPATPGAVMDAPAVARARAMAQRCQGGEPLQYVLGHWAFRALDLLVDPRVLIPRPETEQVVEIALGEVRRLGVPRPLVVDAGTGSGAIALSLATELSAHCDEGRIWAIDASGAALAVAADNLARVRVDHPSMLCVTLVEGDWLHPLPAGHEGAMHLVVANPPYVATSEWSELPGDVRCEPHQALVAADGSDGTAGLADVEAVLGQSLTWLARPGAVVIEMAPHQAGPAVRLARSMGYDDVRVEPDLAGRPRALVARTR